MEAAPLVLVSLFTNSEVGKLTCRRRRILMHGTLLSKPKRPTRLPQVKSMILLLASSPLQPVALRMLRSVLKELQFACLHI